MSLYPSSVRETEPKPSPRQGTLCLLEDGVYFPLICHDDAFMKMVHFPFVQLFISSRLGFVYIYYSLFPHVFLMQLLNLRASHYLDILFRLDFE